MNWMAMVLLQKESMTETDSGERQEDSATKKMIYDNHDDLVESAEYLKKTGKQYRQGL